MIGPEFPLNLQLFVSFSLASSSSPTLIGNITPNHHPLSLALGFPVFFKLPSKFRPGRFSMCLSAPTPSSSAYVDSVGCLADFSAFYSIVNPDSTLAVSRGLSALAGSSVVSYTQPLGPSVDGVIWLGVHGPS